MNTRDVTQVLKSLGWQVGKDEVGDRFAYFHLPDRIVDIIYRVVQLYEGQQLELMLSLSTNVFSDTRRKIRPRGSGHAPLIVNYRSLNIRAPEILAAHVRQGTDEAIAWAKTQDLDQALRNYAALPTNAPGTGPLNHLAALAVLGDTGKLQSYQSRFEAGDRLGFVPCITRDHIDRAVTLAAPFAARARPDTDAPRKA